MPNAAAVSRRSASSSRLNGITGSSSASPSPTATIPRSTRPTTPGAIASEATIPATGIEMASAFRPVTSSPARCVSRM